MLVTFRRGTENKTENIIIALNKFVDHPCPVFLCGQFSFVPPIIRPSISGKKKKKKTGKDVEKNDKYNSRLQQFLCSSRLSLSTVKKKLCGGNMGFRLLKLWVSKQNSCSLYLLIQEMEIINEVLEQMKGNVSFSSQHL